MLVTICGTNREGANSRIVHKTLIEYLNSKHSEKQVQHLDLMDIEFTLGPEQYEEENQSPALSKIQDEYLVDAEKFVFVVPEYNGGFAGIFKLFIDAVSIRKYKPTFKGKKVLLIGVAEGRAGNLRGLDQLTGILMHIGVIVYPKKLPISRVHHLIENGKLNDKGTVQVIHELIDDFLLF